MPVSLLDVHVRIQTAYHNQKSQVRIDYTFLPHVTSGIPVGRGKTRADPSSQCKQEPAHDVRSPGLGCCERSCNGHPLPRGFGCPGAAHDQHQNKQLRVVYGCILCRPSCCECNPCCIPTVGFISCATGHSHAYDQVKLPTSCVSLPPGCLVRGAPGPPLRVCNTSCGGITGGAPLT